MRVGMMWYDGDASRNMDEKVERAAAYYRNKYGRSPNLCLINPEMVGESDLSFSGNVEVRLNSAVLLDHFWVGIRPEEQDEPEAATEAQPVG